MDDVKQCETLFKQLVDVITSVYGNAVTSNEDLIAIGRSVFKPLGNNVIRNCDYDFKRMNGKYGIINIDNGPGIHWCSTFQSGRVITVFDSFDRRIQRLMVEFCTRAKREGYIVKQTKDKNHRREQRDEQSDCGQRCIAWLILSKAMGVEFASLI